MWARMLLMAILLGVVKAHIHFVKLALLAVLGLGGLWMVHTLAQDYNAIRQPVRPKLFGGLVKRQVANNVPAAWEQILAEDPEGCARRVLCELAAVPVSQLRPEFQAMVAFVRTQSPSVAWSKFSEAVSTGSQAQHPSACRNRYFKCRFSTQFILKLLEQP